MERTESRDELTLAQAPSGLGGHGPLAPMQDIGPAESSGELITDTTGPEDDHVLIVGESTRDLPDEPNEVFLAVSFQCALGRASATVTDLRSVTHVTGRAMSGWDVGFEMLEVGSAAGPTGDDGFASIDPDEGDVACVLLAGPGSRLPPEPRVARIHAHDRVARSSSRSVILGYSYVICRTA